MNHLAIFHKKGLRLSKKFAALAFFMLPVTQQFLCAQTEGVGPGYDLYFDGNDYVQVDHDGSLNLGTTYTLECWAKLPSSSGYAPFIHKWETKQYTLGLYNGYITSYIGYNGSSETTISSPVGILANTWFHAAVTYDGDTLKLYVNGELKNTVLLSVVPNNGGSGDEMMMGRLSDASFWHMTGELDEVRIWDNELSQQEIRDWMSKKVTSSHPKYSDLVSYYRFDDVSGSTAYDHKGSNNGVYGGVPTVTKSGAPIGDKCAWYADAKATSSHSISIVSNSNDTITATMQKDSADLLVLYYIENDPDSNDVPSGLDALTNKGYAGVAILGPASARCKVEYKYSGQTYICNESNLRLATRDNDSSNSWTKLDTLPATSADTITIDSVSTSQYIVGSTGNNLFTGNVVYVDVNASGDDNGSSWANAFDDLQEALDLAMACSHIDSILVASGSYFPSQNIDGGSDNRTKGYHMDGEINVIGGFDASTGLHSGYASSVLDGERGSTSSVTDNCAHVFFADDITNASQFEYLTFQNGYAQAYSINFGGYSSTLTESSVFGGDDVPKFRDCVFKNNSGSGGLGGAFRIYDDTEFVNCIFAQNTAPFRGGAVYTRDATDFTNCLFVDNTVTNGYGGAVYCLGSIGLSFTNCTFVDNTTNVTWGSAITAYGGPTLTINNSLFYGNYGTKPIYLASATMHSNSDDNASDLDLATFVGTTTNISSYNYKDIFTDSSDYDGADGIFGTIDDGLSLVDTSGLLSLGDSTGAPNNDVTRFVRPYPPSIGAYQAMVCTDSSALPTGLNTTYSSAIKNTDGDNWSHYCTENGELMLSLKLTTGNAVVPKDSVQLKTGASTTFSTNSYGNNFTNTSGYAMIDRRWNVSPSTNNSTDSVGVRYYFTAQEYSDVVSALSAKSTTISAVTELQMYKATNGDAFADPHTVSSIIISNANNPGTTQWNHASHNTTNHIAEFYVSTFSGGGGGAYGGGGDPLPVKLVDFIAKKAEHQTIDLSWTTASEFNNSHFVVERSYTGTDFEDIGVVVGNGTKQSISNYQFKDDSIDLIQNTVFYRLKQVDFDGTMSYSMIRKVDLENLSVPNEVVAKVFPNPAQDIVYVEFSEDPETEHHSIQLSDNLGRVILSVTTTKSVHRLRMSSLRNGLYFMTIDERQYIKLIKRD